MKKTIRTISGPRADYLLSPSEFRRYSNHMMGYFAVIFAIALYVLAKVFFYEDNFFTLAYDVFVAKNEAVMNEIRLGMFYFKAILCVLPALAAAYFGMEYLTKPTNRQTIANGNFIDDSEEVFENIAKDFRQSGLDNNLCLIRKDEPNTNRTPSLFKKKPSIPYNIYLPKRVCELSWIYRGEAGAGKTVVLDRAVIEAIDAGHKVVLHNIKGDEFDKLNGYCPFYLVEPWNKKAGYAINFMQLLARDSEQDRNAYIYTFVRSFCKKNSKSDDFFHDGAVEVIFAIVKKVVEDNLVGGKCKAKLADIVNLWVSFQANVEDIEIDQTSEASMKKKAVEKEGSLQKVKNILIEKNSTQADLIDVENAKTSLCILATATKTIKKFQVLADFWGNREEEKSLDLIDWLNNPKSRQVLMLSNSNTYVAEAEAYISAVINLLTVFVINPEYKQKSEVHFILDEFPQLSAIDLKMFMKLPDVGRGKGIRVKIALQRTSQIKEIFNMDGASFAGAFQNKIWARMATDDFEMIARELGKQTVIETQSTTNFNATGASGSSKTSEKEKDVCNPADLQNELGPIEVNKVFKGVRVLMKFSNVSRVLVATFPPVSFPKRYKPTKIKSVAGGASVNVSSRHAEHEEVELAQKTPEQEVIVKENLPMPDKGEEVKNPICEAVAEQLTHAVLNEPIAIIFQSADILEALATTNENTNTAEIEDKDSNAKLLSSMQKITRKNKDKENVL
jgi:hypothetical protein